MTRALLLITPLTLSWAAAAASDDLLSDDEFEFEAQEQLTEESNWWQKLDTKLQWQSSVGKEGIFHQRSSLTLSMENAPANNWYYDIAYKVDHYGERDDQSQLQGDSYTRGNLKHAWIQYSGKNCFVKLGRQRLIWGEVEGTFAVDQVTPFDYTEPLLTDYDNIRLSQDLLLTQCYFGDTLVQGFVNPEAKFDLLAHGSLGPDIDKGTEWGLKAKHQWQGGDVSIMAARLYPNQIQASNIVTGEAKSYSFIALSGTMALGRLLFKWDVGHKKDVFSDFSQKEEDHTDIALGIEYTSASNHRFSAGWWKMDLGPTPMLEDTLTISTASWQKSFVNDNLAMSLLTMYVDELSYGSISMMAQYSYNDIGTFSVAWGWTKDTSIPFALSTTPSGSYLSVSGKWQF